MKTPFFLYVFLLGLLYLGACTPKVVEEIQKTPSTTDSVVVVKDTVAVVDSVSHVDSILVEDTIAVLEEPEPVEPVVMSSLERKPCYGKCPSFEVKIYDDGLVIYRGKQYVKRLGYYEAQMDSTTLAKIVTRANEVNFFKYQDTYPAHGPIITDVPTTITYMKLGEQTKTINNHHSSPVSLRRFEKFIEATLEELEWKSVTAPSRTE